MKRFGPSPCLPPPPPPPTFSIFLAPPTGLGAPSASPPPSIPPPTTLPANSHATDSHSPTAEGILPLSASIYAIFRSASRCRTLARGPICAICLRSFQTAHEARVRPLIFHSLCLATPEDPIGLTNARKLRFISGDLNDMPRLGLGFI